MRPIRPQLDSPRMAFGRQILACLALLAASVALGACGGSEAKAPSGNNIDPATASDYVQKLARVRERAAEGRCSGDNSAQSTLAALKEVADANAADTGKDFTTYLEGLLDDLDNQIAEQCEQAPETTSTKSTTSEPEIVDPSTTTLAPVEPAPEPETTEPETTTKPDKSDEKQPEPPAEPTPPKPDGPTPPESGGSGSGGTSPGGITPGRDAPKKPKKAKG